MDDLRLVLFDIDGTLLWSDGSGRTAMESALKRVYGTAGPIEDYYFGGHTDREAVKDLLSAEGIDEQTIWEYFDQLRIVLETELIECIAQGSYRIRPCPGAPELVQAAANCENVLVGLLTGNIGTTAAAKLETAGYDAGLFQVGAYGDESVDRAELLYLAVERAYNLTGYQFRGKQIVVIGDTPADVACGIKLGARSIAVLTGYHNRVELTLSNPDFLFDDLSDTQKVLAAVFAPA
jgi:phosphoglycolate phosphatase